MKKQLFFLVVVVLLFVLGVWKLPEIVTDIGYNKGYAEGYSRGFTQGYAKCEDDMEYVFSRRLEGNSSVESPAEGPVDAGGGTDASGRLPETGSLEDGADTDFEKNTEEGGPGDDDSAGDDIADLFSEEDARQLLEDGTNLIGDVLKELPGKKYEYTERILREELLPRLFDIADEYGDMGYEKGREALEELQE